MSNCLIAYRNVADSATLSGGSWVSTMPLDNLKDRALGVKARTSDDSNASTQFDMAFSSAVGVQVFCLAAHNLSVSAVMRLRASNTAGDFTTAPLYDSGTVSVWGSSYSASSVPWEDDGFWEAVSTFTGLDAGSPTLIHILPTDTPAQYWRMEISDATNDAGYIEAGRLFMSQVWRPTYNMSYDSSVVYTDESVIEQSYGGSEYFEDRARRREMTIRFEFLTATDALQEMLDMQRLRGTTGEILFVWDPDDPENFLQRSMLCRQRELDPIQHARFSAYANVLQLRELI